VAARLQEAQGAEQTPLLHIEDPLPTVVHHPITIVKVPQPPAEAAVRRHTTGAHRTAEVHHTTEAVPHQATAEAVRQAATAEAAVLLQAIAEARHQVLLQVTAEAHQAVQAIAEVHQEVTEDNHI
jgi:hypothetical protein